MTEHTMVTLRLHRIAVILIIVGAVLLAVFIFAGGYLLGARKRVAVPALPAPVSQTVPAPPPQPQSTGQTFEVRVGVFDAEEEAKAEVQQLAARKFAASVVPLKTSAGITLYTVHVGPYPTRAEAAAVADRLAGVVVPTAP